MLQTGISKIYEKEMKIKCHGNEQIDIIVVNLPGIINTEQDHPQSAHKKMPIFKPT